MTRSRNLVILLGICCATLGLAPFLPEPHIVEKARCLILPDTCVIRDGIGVHHAMNLGDRIDLAVHCAPWLALLAALAWRAWERRSHRLAPPLLLRASDPEYDEDTDDPTHGTEEAPPGPKDGTPSSR